MLPRQAIRSIGRSLLSSAGRFLRPARAPQSPARRGPEFRRVNVVAGREPLRPALSGLGVRHPGDIPHRVTYLLIHLGYRWQPSADYDRRQAEMRAMNRRLRDRPRAQPFLPPILYFRDDTDVGPVRLQPRLEDPPQRVRGQRDLPLDLGDLERMARPRDTWFLRPRLAEVDQEFFQTSRPLLPRGMRAFLRHSPYPRVGASVAAALLAVFSFAWMSQVEHAQAEAAHRLHVARHAFRRELDAARRYGLSATTLQQLATRAQALDNLPQPAGFGFSRALAHFYMLQAHDYHSLLGALRRDEQRALDYWTGQEGVAYASLMAATQTARAAGLPVTLSPLPACATPACYRPTVAGQQARAAWLRETAATLRVYAAAILRDPDPVSAAGTMVQQARNLSALLPATVPTPVRIADLDGGYANATDSASYARIGALGHLDADALLADLIHTLPHRALAVSLEDETLTAYQQGKTVFRTPVAAGPATPTGIFHIQVTQASIPALYWSQTGSSYHYVDGSLPDWMAFSANAALQGAPWRSVFGPAGDSSPPLYAPNTPASIDLPPAAAAIVFSWVAPGTEVVIY